MDEHEGKSHMYPRASRGERERGGKRKNENSRLYVHFHPTIHPISILRDSSGLYTASDIAEERYFRMMKFRDNVFFRRVVFFIFSRFSSRPLPFHSLSLSNIYVLTLPAFFSSPSLAHRNIPRARPNRHVHIDNLGSYLGNAR